MNSIEIKTSLSDEDREAIINGVVERIKPLLDARPELVSGDTLSQIIGVGVATVGRLLQAGLIPSVKVGSRRLYRPAAVLAALEMMNMEGREDA